MFWDFLLHFTPGVDSNLERLLKSFPWKMTSCFHHNQTALLKNFEIIQSSFCLLQDQPFIPSFQNQE